MTTSLSEQDGPSLLPASVDAERGVLGGILLDNRAYDETAERLRPEHFSLDSHRRIYQRMVELAESSRPIDMITLIEALECKRELHAIGGVAYVSSLFDGVPERPSIAHYVDIVLDKALRRGLLTQAHVLQLAASSEELSTLEEKIEVLFEFVRSSGRRHDWRGLFHSYDYVINAPPARFAIDGFLQEEGITLIGGLAGHGKTLCMLAMVRALLEGSKLFHHFPVTAKAERVIYLIPEAGLGPFSARLKTFHLREHVQAGRLFCRTLSAQGQLSLTDPRLLEAVKGADVFLDTAIRFMNGAEDAESSKIFADTLFGLQRAGARTICGAHHSPKSFGKDNFMTLENVLRGSGDIGAMLATCWGLSQVDAASNRIFVQNVKARDFSPCEPFIIQGRPSIDESGYFELTHPPRFAGELSDHKSDRKAGRPEMKGKDQKRAEALRLHEQGKGIREISRELGVGRTTISRWLADNSL